MAFIEGINNFNNFIFGIHYPDKVQIHFTDIAIAEHNIFDPFQ